MPIIRESDPRIGCLAVPLSALGALAIVALGAASVGADASTASAVGLGGGALGALVAVWVLRTTGRPGGR